VEAKLIKFFIFIEYFSRLKFFATGYEKSSIPVGKFLMLADSTASNVE
jgi:hypothetical protein